MDQKQFQMNPIGIVNNCQVQVNRKFYKGLKYLSEFSHVILIYKDEKEANIMNSNLCQKTVLLKAVDEKKGFIVIEGIGNCDTDKILYDIKPYFPNEDRVKDAIVPLDSHMIQLLRSSLTQLGTIRKLAGEYYLEIDENFDEYKQILKGFSHIKIIWWFDKFDSDKYRNALECHPPYENAPKTGVFASRSPVRPNPIAMTTARILGFEDNEKRMKVSSLDCFDKTPLLGISPYLPERDFVLDYHLPSWLKHWPEWLDDHEFRVTKAPLLLEADVYQLKKYQEITDENKDEVISFHEAKEKQISYQQILVKGARQNNLKNIDISIPYGKMTVITGVSGSGKSSLAFDTIYAESQQRFLASMTLSERSQFVQLEKPEYDQIIGLPPAIAISQQNNNHNPRSTVGTVTDLYGLFRTLYAHLGIRHCPKCGRAIMKMTYEEIIEQLCHCVAGTSLKIKPHSQEYEQDVIVCEKFNDKYDKWVQDLEVTVKKNLLKGNGAIQVLVNNYDLLTFQTTEKCYECDFILFEMTPADFSFNNLESMCPVCHGLGIVMDIDARRIVQNPHVSILDGASSFWGNLRHFQKKPNANWMRGEILALANELQVDLELPWNELPKEFRTQAIYGTEKKEVTFTYQGGHGRINSICRPVEGAYHILKRLLQNAENPQHNSMIKQFSISQTCHCCHGERLKIESRLVTVADKRFPEIVQMDIKSLRKWIIQLSRQLNSTEVSLYESLLKEIYTKLSQCIKIGLEYLSLDRSVPSLSGGEWQRIQLIGQLNSGISHILYILDEPTAGLHPKDYDNLLEIIDTLKRLGNTIILVEHTREIMLAADYIIDIGPKAGVLGGYLVAQGTPYDILHNHHSETGLYLSHQKSLHRTCQTDMKEWVCIHKINGNNLQNIDVKFPLYAMTCITGVSGSGKSSLMAYGILPAIQSQTYHSSISHTHYESVTGAKKIKRIVHITQKPIGRSSRSTPATYTGLMDEIRLLFSQTELAQQRKYTLSHFSYNNKEGQCPVCHGYGYKTIEASFMPTMKTKCSLCKGQKYDTHILQILYQGKTISQVLNMSVVEALDFFKKHEKISKMLKTLNDIGLGYILLGQNSQTLSGGEAQRIKLATELQTERQQDILYLLDEPTTGLHLSDIQNLLDILTQIIQKGNTVILIEHHLDVIQNADWIIDLGPEGGNRGGYLNAQGTVLDIMQCSSSHTGQLLVKNME